jgi:multiple sugar transport system ATP-binding protein
MSLADRISVMHQGRIIQAADPLSVYRDPAERFVGSFIGNPPMNFLPATPEGGGKWRVAGQSYAGPKTDHTALDFAIRPEDLQPSVAGLAAVVKVVEPLGAHVLVTCAIDGQMFRAVLDSDTKLAAGETITLQPNADRIRWFDPQSQVLVR